MTTDKLFLTIALILIAAGFGYAYVTSPTTVTIAVGPADSQDAQLFHAFGQQLKTQRVALRLRIKSVPDAEAASKLLDKGEADLAVVRPDISTPVNGLTVALLREAAVIILAPEGSIPDLSALAGKSIGIGIGHAADPGVMKAILQHLELDTPSIGIVPMPRDDILYALKENRIQAAAIVAPPASRIASNFVRLIAAGYEGKIDILGVDSPEMLVQRSPTLSAVTIQAGLWGVRPKRPAEDMKTVGVGYRVMAHKDLDRSIVAVFTESLFQMRTRLAMAASSANQMRAPEMDTASTATTAVLPNHPGAVDYFQRETQSVMDRWGDWIYLGAFFGSGLISAAAALQQRFRRQGREKIDDVLDRLISILADARCADSTARLDDLSTEVDGLLSRAVDHARDRGSGARATAALVLALDGARTALAERRRTLVGRDEGRREGGPRLVTVS